jgi:uncharacterized membrane protein
MPPLDLSALTTPLSWFIVELLSVVLLLWCMADAIRTFSGNTRIVRIGEIFGFIAYSGVYENVGVAAHIYYYSLDRIVLFGKVPLAILIIEAVIFYVAMRTAEKLRMPIWAAPFLVGMLAMAQDLTIDPSACFDFHEVNGVMEGRWNWTMNYEHGLFGIPFANFSGWFTMMFYFAATLLVGRRWFERKHHSTGIGTSYILISILVSLLLIVSPLNRFLLTLYPFTPWDQRANEIVMLALNVTVAIAICWRYASSKGSFNLRDDRVIWLLPVTLHAYDILAAYILHIKIAYIPSILFAIPHLALLAYFFRDELFRDALLQKGVARDHTKVEKTRTGSR